MLQAELTGDFAERRQEWKARGRCRQCGSAIEVIAGVRRCEDCGLAVDAELTRDLAVPVPPRRVLPWTELAKLTPEQREATQGRPPPAARPRSEEAEKDVSPPPVPWAVKAQEEREARAAAALGLVEAPVEAEEPAEAEAASAPKTEHRGKRR
jgi:hypothetical protein